MPKKKPIILSTAEGRKKFYQSSEWRLLRKLKLTEHPFCEICWDNKIKTLATEVHHIVDIQDDPTKCLTYNNLQSLCKSCHSKITSSDHPITPKYEVVNKKWRF